MSPLFHRVVRAQQANADQARRIPRRPIHDWQRLTAAELERLRVLLANARRLSKGKRIDWRKVSDDDLIEIQEYYRKARGHAGTKARREGTKGRKQEEGTRLLGG